MTATDRTAAAPPVRDHSGKRRWVGQSIRRVEDPKFLLGRGGYIADRITPGTLHAAVLRSPHAHARIVRIEAGQAKAAPGVHAVITGPEAAELCNPMPDFGPDPARHTWRCLAADKVRYVGEGVAVVVADSRYLAEDALELIEVEYEPLPPVTDPERALADGAPLVHEALESNCAYERTFDFGDVDRDFAEADVVVRDRLRWHRSGGQPLETVGAIAEYDPGTGSFTIDTNTLSFTSYLFMAAGTLKVPVNKLDIRPVPAGGSFGSKLFANKPGIIAAMCARKTGRKVAYLENRVDNISNCDHHGSNRVYDVELAVMRDGTMRGIKIDVVDDYGAYIQFGVGHHGNALAQVTGPYTIGSVRYRVRAALTNKNQQGAYRGFGSEVNNWMLEQMVELAARELGLDPVAIRRKNFIRQFPHFIPTGNVYDSGDYDQVLDKALELADYGHWRAEQKRLREEEGRCIGIGLITAQERSVFSATEFWFWFDEPGAPVTSTPESVSLKVDATGGITAVLYSCAFWGNSPETMVAQFVAEEFDCSPYDVSVVYHGSRDGLPGHRSWRLPHDRDAGGRRRGGGRQDQGEGPPGRRPPARDRPGRRGMVRRRLRCQGRPGAEEVTGRDRDRAAPVQAQLPGGHGKRSGRVEGVRPPVHDDAVRGPEGPRRLLPLHGPRLPHPRGGGGHRDRRGHVPALHGGARLRDAGEPALAGRAHRRRHGPGHRDRPVRGVRLRRRRPAAVVELPRLPDPVGDGGA